AFAPEKAHHGDTETRRKAGLTRIHRIDRMKEGALVRVTRNAQPVCKRPAECLPAVPTASKTSCGKSMRRSTARKRNGCPNMVPRRALCLYNSTVRQKRESRALRTRLKH